MNINFNDVTWQKLLFLANSRGMSVPGFVAQKMDELTDQLVNVEYSMNSKAHGENSFMLLPSDKN